MGTGISEARGIAPLSHLSLIIPEIGSWFEYEMALIDSCVSPD